MSKSNDSPIENGDKRNSKGQFGEGNQFSKGRGRPKGSPSIPDILRRVLGEEIGTIDKMTRLEAILIKVVKEAYDGDKWAVNFLADRLEGKPKQILGLQEVSDEPIQVFDFDEVDD